MLNRDDLKTHVQTITNVDADVGSAIPENMRRFIYKIKATNLHNAANLLTLGKREDGAVGTTDIDYVQFANEYDIWNDPDELKEDAAPLYVIEGKGDTGDSYLRAVVANATAYLIITYIDAPA